MNKLITTIALVATLSAQASAQNSLSVGEVNIITSAILNEDREIFVYTPPGYSTGDKVYPTLYILDGQWYFMNGVAIQQTLRGEQLLPEMIIVGINMPRPKRDHIFADRWEDFKLFIKREVVSWVDQKFRTSGERLLFGWEDCGPLACELLLDEEALFSGAIASNGAGFSPEMIDSFAKRDTGTKYLYMANTVKDIYTIDRSNKAVAVLEKTDLPNLEWEYRLFDDERHQSLAYTSIYQGLRFYYHNFGSLMFSSTREFYEYGGISGIKQYFQQRGERFGLAPEIDHTTKNRLIWLAWRHDDFKSFKLFMTAFADVLTTPRYASAYWQNRFAQFYLKHNDLENAIHYFNEGIEDYPDDKFMAEMYSGLGTAYFNKNNKKLARRNYNKAIAAAEKNSDSKVEFYREQLGQVK